jgi:hypothetical protein
MSWSDVYNLVMLLWLTMLSFQLVWHPDLEYPNCDVI